MNDSSNDQPVSSSNESTSSSDSKGTDEAALQLKSSVIEGAHDLTDQAKHLAGGVISQARESAGDQISSGKARVADGLGSVADALRQTGEQLRSNDAASLTDYATRAADQVEAASDYLKENSLSDVLEDVSNFARREPAMFLGGAFVLGLVGGRFLKSSHVQVSTDSAPSKAQPNAGRGQGSASRQTSSGRESQGRPTKRRSPPPPATPAPPMRGIGSNGDGAPGAL